MTAVSVRPVLRPYQPFPLRVLRTERLSTSFLRVTLAGESLVDFSCHGFDQRINLLFLPVGADPVEWAARGRDCGAPLRVYTVRAFRPLDLEIDIDFVLHGDAAPASRWAAAATAGAPVVMIGATHGHPVSDVAWKPPARADRLLLAADGAALPAAASILAGLDRPARAVIEVPAPDDRLPLPGGHDITWLVRSRGERLGPAVRELLDATAPAGVAGPAEPVDDVWEVPEQATGSFYAWLAGESGVVCALRRHLVGERGIDRRSVAFMGYWKSLR
ncbi:siderophore-interacting protein [Actinoplanes sp. N902-109]|uniref:siderophore-interacting protein n=1 Tax=Actinoplanes sp. (strain N902-109) TaxID=649831 RepID=UPI0003293DA3|nr:siderophore-interacting protein [Actinoplanes sp. N902-109]AGL19954.1 FAD-binding 9 siderophore-interacting domain-containing protein [Actinoplanes sp. N902-109]